MRIAWSEESARLVEANLEKLHEQMTSSLDQSKAARAALQEANPDGENKRLNALGKTLDDCLARLKQAGEDADDLLRGTRYMIDTFGETEREVLRMIEGVQEKVAASVYASQSGAAMAGTLPASGASASGSPGTTSVLGPHSSVGGLGPVPGWLNDRLERYRSTYAEGGATWDIRLL